MRRSLYYGGRPSPGHNILLDSSAYNSDRRDTRQGVGARGSLVFTTSLLEMI